MPDRASIGAAFLPMAIKAGLTSAIIDARSPQLVRSVKAADLLLNRDAWGAAWIAAHRAQPGSGRSGGHVTQASDAPLSRQHRGRRPGGAAPACDLVFEPAGTRVRVPPGVTLFDAASWNGIAIDSTCGGHGTCKKCKVRIVDGAARGDPAGRARVLPGRAAGGLAAGLPGGDRADAAGGRAAAGHPAEGGHRRGRPAGHPAARRAETLPGAGRAVAGRSARPTSSGCWPPWTTWSCGRTCTRCGSIGRVLRAADYKVTAVIVDDVLIDVQEGDTTGRLYGIAFDLGTTTVVATLLDLSTGTPMAVASMLSKQQPFGADVITRISAVMMDPAALGRLTGLAHESLNELAAEVCAAGRGRSRRRARGGDGGQRHDDPPGARHRPGAARRGARSSCPPGCSPRCWRPTSGVGVHPRARAVVFPSFGAYVGGDITAGLLASGMDRDSRTRLFVDIGTNCEIVLGNRDWLLGTAAPGRAGLRGRGDPVRHARRRRGDRGRTR